MANGQASAEARQPVATAKVTMMLALAGVAGLSVSGQAPREWRDYAGGPDSSRFVAATQITKDNVHQLQVAWTYPPGQTDFNPLVVRGVVYGLGANGSFVALDAATGNEIWIHKGVQGFTGRGVNYWESKDGTDRRLIFSTGNILQEIDARTGESIPTFGVDGRVDLRVGLDRDPSTVNQQSRIPGRVFENLIILGSATNQEYASAPGDIRAFDVRTGRQGLDVSHRAAARRVRLRDVARGRVEDRRRRQQLGRAIDRREPAAFVYVPTGSPQVQLLRREQERRQPVRRLPHRTRCPDRQAALAFPDRASRHLGPRQQFGAAVDDHPPERPDRSTSSPWPARPATSTYSIASPAQPIWPIEERPVPQKTTVPGEALWPTQPFPTSPPPFSRQKFTADDVNPHILTPEEREQFRQRILKAQKRRAVHADRVRRRDSHAGQSGRIELGQHRRQSHDGSVYVIGFNVPTIIRLLKAGEMRAGRAGGPPETVTEGRYVTEGFGLYPTIVNPP